MNGSMRIAMGEEENAKFQAAEQLWQSGNVGDAVRIHFNLCLNGQDPRMRLGSAMVLVDRLKFPQEPEKLLQVCTVAIESAKQLSDAMNKALFMAKRAEYLVIFNGLTLLPARKRLRMAPGWFAFALESDEKQYVRLTRQLEANDREADSLSASALRICEQNGDASAKGRVLMCAGTIAFQRYMNHKLDGLPPRMRVPSWLIAWLRDHHLDEYVLYDAETRREMRKLLNECKVRYVTAANIFRDAGEESIEAYAFYNLANELRSAYRFAAARKYLGRARLLAERHKNKQLLKGIHLLEKSIRLKNRDTPNYVAGEQRPPEETVA
jgi:hypothetical protein